VAGGSREPGWYPDQHDPEYNRYWNGRAWTARRHPVGSPPPASVDPTSAARQPVSEARASVQPSKPKQRIPVWLWLIGGLLVLRSITSVIAAFDPPAPGATTAIPSHPAVATPSPGTSH
jgi:hypothetical protein